MVDLPELFMLQCLITQIDSSTRIVLVGAECTIELLEEDLRKRNSPILTLYFVFDCLETVVIRYSIGKAFLGFLKEQRL